MNSDRWTRVNEIFLTVADFPASDQKVYLCEVCGDDAELQAEVEQLLASDHTEDDSFLAPVTEFPGLILPGIDAQDPLLGRRVSHYEIRSLLGVGGMGRVYLATRVEDYSEQVVIKFLRRELGGEEMLRRFHNEMHIQAALGSHPNIARLLDAGANDDGYPFLVMEYVDGVEIDEFCDQHKPSISDRLRLFRVVCDAVQFAHQHAVIHRDLKPSNILVTATGEPKLIDFGIAKLLEEDEAEAQTQTAYRALTPHYASPEHLKGRTLTTASDVYSLGVVLYELLTGRRPYRLTSKSAAEVELLVCVQEPTRPSSVIAKDEFAPASRRQLVGDVDNIVLKSLRKEPQNRYQSAQQLADDIDRYLRGLPIRAQRLTWRYRTSKFVRRNKAPVIAVSLLLLSLVGGIVGTTTQWFDARENAAAAMQANQELEANQRRGRQQLYAARMNLVQQAWEAGSLQRMTEILDHYAAPVEGEDLRGFEWHYWQRMCQRHLASHHIDARPTCLALSHYTNVAVVGAANGDIEFWNLDIGKQIHKFSNRGARVASVAISSDGKLLASAHAQREVRLWNLETGALIRTFAGHTYATVGVAFTADKTTADNIPTGSGRLISAAGRWNRPGEVIVWDIDSGEKLSVVNEHGDYLRCLAVSHDGRMFATGAWDHRIVLWNSDTGKPIGELGKHNSAVTGIAFSPDGKTLASTGADYTVRVWDLTARELMFSLRGHAGEVNCASYSPDATHLATGGNDGAVKLWDVRSGELQATIVGHVAGVTGVAFDGGGETLTTAGTDGSLKRWMLEEALNGAVLRGHSRAIYAIAFSPDGKALFSGGYDNTLRRWDLNSRTQTAQVTGKFGRFTSLLPSPDGAHIYSAHRLTNPAVRLWKVTGVQDSPVEINLDQDPAEKLRPGRVAVVAAALSPSGKHLAEAQGGKIILWDTSTWQSQFEWVQKVSVANRLAISSDGKLIAISGPDRVVRVLDVTTGNLVAELSGHEDLTTAVAYAPNGKQLATGSSDNTIRIWDAQTHQHQQTLMGHSATIDSLAFSPDGTTLASGGADAVVKLWDLDSGEQTTTLRGHTRVVTAVQFSPDGNTLASASEDGTIRLWHGR